MASLPKELRGHPFTYQKAIELGLSRQELRELVNSGSVDHFGRNLYQESGQDYSEEDQFRIATEIVGTPSAICLLSALAFYGCTDLISKQTWIMVPDFKRTARKDIKVFRVRNPNWSVGIISKKAYSITTLERTLVEAIAYKARLGSQVGISAFKTALSEKKVRLKDVADVATQLGVFHKIKGVLEILT